MGVESSLLSELHELMKKYQVEFYYTIDDDGVHVASFGNDVFVGSLHADHTDELKEAIKRWEAVPSKAPYTAFGKTKMLPVKVYVDGNYVDDKPQWDLEMWIERSEEWYAFSSKSLRGKRVRVVTREDWLRCKVTEVTSGR